MENNYYMLLNRIQNINDLKEYLNNDVKEFVQNKNIPLKDRWDIFCFGDFGEEEPFIEHFKSFDDEYLFGDIERYKTININYIEDCLWDRFANENSEIPEWYYEEEETKRLELEFEKYMIPIKEEILEKYIKSFRMDW